MALDRVKTRIAANVILEMKKSEIKPPKTNKVRFAEVDPRIVSALPVKKVALRDNPRSGTTPSLSSGYHAMKLLSEGFTKSEEGKILYVQSRKNMLQKRLRQLYAAPLLNLKAIVFN